MPMISMEATILIPIVLVRISLHFLRPLQGWIILDLHKNLLKCYIQWGILLIPLCTTFRYAFFDLDNWPVELPPMITLISPSDGRDDSSIFPFNFLSLWSRPRKFLNFPCLMRFSICCFKSKYSSVSCP